jgi:hypothetical protein
MPTIKVPTSDDRPAPLPDSTPSHNSDGIKGHQHDNLLHVRWLRESAKEVKGQAIADGRGGHKEDLGGHDEGKRWAIVARGALLPHQQQCRLLPERFGVAEVSGELRKEEVKRYATMGWKPRSGEDERIESCCAWGSFSVSHAGMMYPNSPPPPHSNKAHWWASFFLFKKICKCYTAYIIDHCLLSTHFRKFE